MSDQREASDELFVYRRIGELAVDAVPSAVLAVHESGALAVANTAARRLFGISGDDIGRPFGDLALCDRAADLRPAVEQVRASRRPLVLEQVDWAAGSEAGSCFDIHVVPVDDAVVLTFVEVSSVRDLDKAYEELQSTNEELETMNAELHSTNRQLQTINDELRTRTDELDEANDFLQSLLTSQRGGFVVIDRDQRISVWNDQSVELWGIRSDEAPGQHFLNLDIGLPVEELRQPIKAVLAGEADRDIIEVNATNRRGREFRCRVTIDALTDRDRQIRGAMLLMEDAATL